MTESSPENKPKYLYIETTSDEAVSLIESLTRVSTALSLIRDPSFSMAGIGYECMEPVIRYLSALETIIRRRIRHEILQPEPVTVSEHLINKLREQLEKEKGLSKL